MKWVIVNEDSSLASNIRFRNPCEAEEYKEHLLKKRKEGEFCIEKLENSVVLPVGINNNFDVSFAFNEDTKRVEPTSTMKFYNQAMLGNRDKFDDMKFKKDYIKYYAK